MLQLELQGAAMSDQSILRHISDLVDEENRLRLDAGKPDHNAERLRHVQEQLDQCWDLLRQRRAKREFGRDPDTADVRDPKTVEGYSG
jgi:hypothetical protein